MREPSDPYILCVDQFELDVVICDLVDRRIPFDWRPGKAHGSRVFIKIDDDQQMEYLVSRYDLVPTAPGRQRKEKG